MIADITRGKNTHDLIRYVYGPGLANEHTDPHLVASWNGSAPDPARSEDFQGSQDQLVAALNLRVEQAGDRAPVQHVWHCSIHAAPEDRSLTDEDWAAFARRIVHASGIAAEGDPDGCRWVAVRHADDHIHVLATTVRGDLRPAEHQNDHLAADKELAVIEREYGLHQVVCGEHTAAQHPTRAEHEKAHRADHQLTAREHLEANDPQFINPHLGRPKPNPWHQASAAIERIPTLLDRDDDAAAQAHLAAFGTALAALPPLSLQGVGPQLQLAAIAFERVTRPRSRIRADHHHARALRSAVRAMRRQPVKGDATALAMFLGSAVLVVIAAIRWHQLRDRDHQVIAAHRTLQHLQAAYDLAAAKPLAALALRMPTTATPARYAHLVHEAVPEHAQQILYDPAWGAMFAVLAEAEAAGHQPARLLQQAARHCNLDDARSPAHVLTWRIHRLAQRPAPSTRALAAQVRSTIGAPGTARPTQPPTDPSHPDGPAASVVGGRAAYDLAAGRRGMACPRPGSAGKDDGEHPPMLTVTRVSAVPTAAGVSTAAGLRRSRSGPASCGCP
ncbi:mobilization protein [Streptomyces sp. NBC_01481]|uniref:mobilization protein n=1 Tax=Streptomyces sp. NBC_01481 TaxID=2975869 RepID=UPI002255099F|nr:mobilization protein [Streptomyces sp. NBC_01481]MCX4588132.1 mobilization protein [Streptomyces sp. NBC_01481]